MHKILGKCVHECASNGNIFAIQPGDNSLLVSDDRIGANYRITWEGRGGFKSRAFKEDQGRVFKIAHDLGQKAGGVNPVRYPVVKGQ